MGYRNSEGYHDPTAYAAMKDGEKEKLDKLIKTLYSITDLAGFRIQERIILVNKKSGRIWR
jgi:hypothetical protein